MPLDKDDKDWIASKIEGTVQKVLKDFGLDARSGDAIRAAAAAAGAPTAGTLHVEGDLQVG